MSGSGNEAGFFAFLAGETRNNVIKNTMRKTPSLTNSLERHCHLPTASKAVDIKAV